MEDRLRESLPFHRTERLFLTTSTPNPPRYVYVYLFYSLHYWSRDDDDDGRERERKRQSSVRCVAKAQRRQEEMWATDWRTKEGQKTPKLLSNEGGVFFYVDDGGEYPKSKVFPRIMLGFQKSRITCWKIVNIRVKRVHPTPRVRVHFPFSATLITTQKW